MGFRGVLRSQAFASFSRDRSAPQGAPIVSQGGLVVAIVIRNQRGGRVVSAAEVVAAQVVADFAARRLVANRRKAAEYRKSLIASGILKEAR